MTGSLTDGCQVLEVREPFLICIKAPYGLMIACDSCATGRHIFKQKRGPLASEKEWRF